jgi:uncharacterized membrane protein
MKRVRVILIWIVGISFIIIGALKYVNLDEMTRPVFDRAHFPKWFFYAVGAVEFTAGFLMIMTANSSRRLGSILISLVMIGAIGTRYMLREPLSHFMVPGFILFIAILTILGPRPGRKMKQKGA